MVAKIADYGGATTTLRRNCGHTPVSCILAKLAYVCIAIYLVKLGSGNWLPNEVPETVNSMEHNHEMSSGHPPPLRVCETVTLQALQAFATDLHKFEMLLAALDAQPVEFNLFDLLNLWRDENTHSQMLTWLLDPKGNHGIGDYFLRMFLHEIKALPRNNANVGWSEAQAKREWHYNIDGETGRLDILIINEEAKVLFAIENKIFSTEGIDEEGISQLTRYRTALEKEFRDFTRHHVFLSRQGDNPQSEEEQEHWVSIGYATVAGLAEGVLANRAMIIEDKIRNLVEQYVAILRRKIVPQADELKELALKIYSEHRQAIELINGYKPDVDAEVFQNLKPLLRNTIEQHGPLKWDSESQRIFRYRSEDWDQFESFRTGTGWPQSESVLVFEILLENGGIRHKVILGPSQDAGVREHIYYAVSKHPRLFSRAGKAFTPRWTILDNRILLTAEEFDDLDLLRLHNEIHRWLATFAEDTFRAMNKVIIQTLREYGQGQ